MASLFLDRDQLREYKQHRFHIDASEIGLAPGTPFPQQIETNAGNGAPFILREFSAEAGALYWQQHGCITLLIFND